MDDPHDLFRYVSGPPVTIEVWAADGSVPSESFQQVKLDMRNTRSLEDQIDPTEMLAHFLGRRLPAVYVATADSFQNTDPRIVRVNDVHPQNCRAAEPQRKRREQSDGPKSRDQYVSSLEP